MIFFDWSIKFWLSDIIDVIIVKKIWFFIVENSIGWSQKNMKEKYKILFNFQI